MKANLNNILVIFMLLVSLLFYSCKDNVTDSSNNSGKTKGGQQPSWYPDGNSIAYIGGTTFEDFGIYAINIDGTDMREIAVPEYANLIDWSPDGLWISYTKGGNIYKRKIGDTSDIQLTFDGSNFFPSWSKDGQWIAFDSNSDSPNGMYFIWKMRADGTERKRIIYSPTVGEVRQPDWFPDGLKLAVSRYVGHGAPEIAIIDTNGNSIALLTNDEIFDRSPRVSNDGAFIVFEKDGNGGQIFIIKTDGTELTKITSGDSNTPNWSPDGNWITYSSYDPTYIFVINRNGLLKRKL